MPERSSLTFERLNAEHLKRKDAASILRKGAVGEGFNPNNSIQPNTGPFHQFANEVIGHDTNHLVLIRNMHELTLFIEHRLTHVDVLDIFVIGMLT